MFYSFFTFYIVDSSTKRVRSPIVFTRRILDFKFILTEEFRLSYLSTVKNFSSYKS
jgi:hypothetical protein